MKNRLYPFTEPIGSSVSNGSNTNPVYWTGTITTYKPNPFQGIDRVAFALDEWAHRRGLVMTNHRPWELWRKPWMAPFALLCNWWDRRLGG